MTKTELVDNISTTLKVLEERYIHTYIVVSCAEKEKSGFVVTAM